MFHHLFHQSYNTSILPSTWNHAVICPVIKKGIKSLPYRPVSLIAIPYKIMEHSIVSNMWNHLSFNNIVTSKQHGFRKGMSCETQLSKAMNDWTGLVH